MRVCFVKNPPASDADELICHLDNGDEKRLPLPRAGVLPLLAVQFVVEQTMGWSDGLFACIAHGTTATDEPAVKRSCLLAQTLQAAIWSGGNDPTAFRRQLDQATSTACLDPIALNDDDFRRLKDALRSFGSEWRPLGSGKILSKEYVC